MMKRQTSPFLVLSVMMLLASASWGQIAPSGERFVDMSVERRKSIEEDIMARWREIFGVDPVWDMIEIPTGYPDLKKPGIPVLPQVRSSDTRPLGKRQIIPHVPAFGGALGPSGNFKLSGFEDFTNFLVESKDQFIADAKPNQYNLRAFQTFVSMVHSGKLRLADMPSGSRNT